ncbi:NAD-P-binding protein [Stereum hirsutum FP-91666 SS1]|uniref:NAD-P-binding protein n=1 Tax=Stereum hirsutum (strain FP-91666) TaxID=721885 RepID=UPI000440A298|nr:NAD-P-binding protein [Stereum hirsutum FP-91666 SS1]EIM92948.1 NAD-P-binding protein [Stereum hirsutum FP-91666 SS1]
MGALFSTAFSRYDPKRDIPDLTGKVAIVTGANSGIGLRTAELLAVRGAKVYLACRTESKATNAIYQILKAHSDIVGLNERLAWLPLDLSSVVKSEQAAKDFLAIESRLDILVNNAARGIVPYALSEEGIELSVATNHLGHFVLTNTLLPLLTTTSRMPDTDVRIVNVASHSYASSQAVKFDGIEDLNNPQGASGKENGISAKLQRYGTTKLMNILHARELQRRLDAEAITITVLSLHPGTGVITEGYYTGNYGVPAWLVALLPIIRFLFLPITTTQGAYNSTFAATSAEVAAERGKYKGQYLEPLGKIVALKTRTATDVSLIQDKLWNTSEKVVRDTLQARAAP